MLKRQRSISEICKYLVPAILIAANVSVPIAFAEEEKPEVNNAARPSILAAADELGLTVDDINDVGFALQRIRQQAINIYLEAVRRKESTEVKAQVPTLAAVPDEFPKSQAGLLPFRRPWLVYFITTLEPLIHLLKEDLKEIENGSKTADLPEHKKKALQPLIKDWTQNVLKIDKDLSSASELIEDADKNNITLAKIAYELDGSVAKLEQIRDKAFRIVYDHQSHKKHRISDAH